MVISSFLALQMGYYFVSYVFLRSELSEDASEHLIIFRYQYYWVQLQQILEICSDPLKSLRGAQKYVEKFRPSREFLPFKWLLSLKSVTSSGDPGNLYFINLQLSLEVIIRFTTYANV